MFRDKYASIFSSQMETIVFIILQIFFAMHAVLKIGEYSPVLAGEYQKQKRQMQILLHLPITSPPTPHTMLKTTVPAISSDFQHCFG